MDTSSATPQPIPRLRVSRPSPSGRRDNASVASSSQAGPSRLTDFTQLVDLNLSDIRAVHASTDEDDDDDQYPTPRMTATATLTPSSATPTPNLAGRLRELIHLVPNGSGSQSTPVPHRPPSPTFHESDFEGESTAAGHSRARESLRDIFSKALREPGDTPQKNSQRRNSDSSASEMDISPATSRKWSDVKGKRRSPSDEPLNETTNFLPPESTSHPISRLPRDTNGISFPLKDISAEDTDDADDFPSPKRISSSIPYSTTVQSLRLSQNTSFPQQSNLLDQDSEMHRVFDGLESSDADERPTQSTKPHDFNSRAPIEPSSTTPPAPKRTAAISHTPKHPRKSLDSATPHANQSTSTVKPTPRLPNGHMDGTERTSGHRRTSLQGSTPPTLKHKGSAASFQFSDRSSVMSASDYGERVKDMEKERNHERERDWNRPQPRMTRPGSSLSLRSPQHGHRSRTSSISSMESVRPGSAMSIESGELSYTRTRTTSGLSERQRTTSTGSRPGSAMSGESMSIADFPNNLRRHNSLTSRADSPASSQGGEAGVEHERERNWNAPRPKWHRRSLPNTPDRPESPRTTKLSSPQPPADARRHSTTPQSALKDTSNTTRSGSSLGRRHSQPKVVPPSPSPAERRATTTPTTKSPHSRIPTAVTGTPTRSQSPLTKPGSNGKSRLPVPSSRAQGSRQETPKPIPSIHVNGEAERMQIHPTISFPQSVNGQSMSQQSMELTEAYNAHEDNSAIPSFSGFSHGVNNDTMHTASLLDAGYSRDGLYGNYEDEENPLAQERTPTLQASNPLLEGSRTQDFEEPSIPVDETRPEIPPIEEEFEPSSPDIQPSDVNQSSIPSFLSTPPRHSSFNSSKLEFQTPSPPRGLPDLPGPPSAASGDEGEEESLPQFNITPANPLPDGLKNGDMTAFKTPKPPGAWFATPLPSNHPPHRDDSTQGFVDSSSDGGFLNAPNHTRSVFPQTPAPPGGWMNTPAAARQRAHSDPKSILNEGGLSTPLNSLGRANTMPAKTPAPPGGWMNTPGFGSARKSVLKVRFDPEVTGAANISSDTFPESSVENTNGARSTTPEPVMPSTPPSRSPRKHKKSPPSVRMVDAYGNEQKPGRNRQRDSPSPTPSTPRNKSGIRIVDALGREVQELEDEESKVPGHEVTMEPSEAGSLTRAEALQRVRQGILELAEGIESLDFSGQSRDDAERIKELDEKSRALKQSREVIAKDMQKAEKSLRRQVRQKISASSFLGRNGWFLFCVGIVQLILIFIMYRASVLRARKLFLTNYYDPFNPDLFLYTNNPDTQYAKPTISWSLITQAIRRGDITAFTGAFRENLSILIKRWHQQIWDVWGDDPNRPVGAWPPT